MPIQQKLVDACNAFAEKVTQVPYMEALRELGESVLNTLGVGDEDERPESDTDLAHLKRRLGLPRKIADGFAVMEKTGRVLRINLHAADFERMRTDGEAMFDSNPGDGGKMGMFWGADVFIDPTMPEGMMGLISEMMRPDGSKGSSEVHFFTIR